MLYCSHSIEDLNWLNAKGNWKSDKNASMTAWHWTVQSGQKLNELLLDESDTM